MTPMLLAGKSAGLQAGSAVPTPGAGERGS